MATGGALPLRTTPPNAESIWNAGYLAPGAKGMLRPHSALRAQMRVSAPVRPTAPGAK